LRPVYLRPEFVAVRTFVVRFRVRFRPTFVGPVPFAVTRPSPLRRRRRRCRRRYRRRSSPPPLSPSPLVAAVRCRRRYRAVIAAVRCRRYRRRCAAVVAAVVAAVIAAVVAAVIIALAEDDNGS